MAINTTQSPLIQWELNEDGTRKTVEVLNEEVKIINNQAILNWKPSKYHRVTLSDITVDSSTVTFMEIELNEVIDTVNKFKVNYDNGIIYFHSNLEGFTLNISRYYDEGIILYHVSRIYYRDSNDVLHTLEEVLNSITEMSSTLQLVGIKILNTYATLAELKTAHPTGNSGDMYAVGTENSNVIYVWSTAIENWFSIGSLKGDKGDIGLAGLKGDTGATPNLTIGTITTGNAGTSASVTITGTTPNLVLNMTIPKGDAGVSGASSWSEITGKPTSSVTNIDNSATQLAGKSVVTTLGTDDTTVPTSKAVADKIGVLSTKIDSGVTTTPIVSLGMNSVIRKTDNIESFPKFTMQGKSYTNGLSKDGNCEDVSKWATFQSTLSLDASKKVFGVNAIKLTLTGVQGGAYRYFSAIPTLDITKYYLMSAYVDKGNATNIALTKDNGGGGNIVTVATAATTPTRIAIKVQPSDMNIGNAITLYANGTSGQYAYVDGIMINEITATEYANDSVDTLMTRYPYVDSYACLQNPCIEVRHDNLVRNGNGEEGVGYYIGTSASMSIENGRFKVISTTTNGYMEQEIHVSPNTTYYLKFNGGLPNAYMQVYGVENGSYLFQNNVSGTFTTGINKTIKLRMIVTAVATVYYDSIHLIEWTTAPTSYKPCRIERCVIEGKFTSDDTFTYENGEVSGLLKWKHKTLFGKDYDWVYEGDTTGAKRIAIANPNFPNITTGVVGNKCIKYDGKPLIEVAGYTPDTFTMWTNNNFYLSISDTDTGFAEAIAPNADEVKAFMNGWRAIQNTGTRYINWVSIVDGSIPSGAIKSTVSTTTNTTSLSVTSGGTSFASGDMVYIFTSTMGFRATATVTGTPTTTSIPITTSVSVASGDIVALGDNGVKTNLLTYCKNNIAPNYEGYQLHYKLANPEPITNTNVRFIGDIPKLD